MAKTYIIGHQKPDTDSVVAALALEYLYNQDPGYGYQNPTAVIADPLNPETKYLFDKFNLQAPPLISAAEIKPEDKVVLVDHNEPAQRLPGLNQEQIVEIVDHHKANLNFSQPIFLTFKTWGSSSSIVYYMMKRYSSQPIQPDKSLASLMLAAVLSDTVGFKSATTTDQDKNLATQLATIAGITDLDAFALEIFKAKSNLDDLSDQELVKNDYKQYDFSQSVLIGQLETVEQQKLLTERKDGLLQAMNQIKQEEGVDLIFLAVTDVLQANTKLLISNQAGGQLAEKAFGGQTQAGVLDIGPKLSRKKEIAPAIERALT
ncbi:MAG: manganese-dependent inorganic pyrophosphatase [Candidatus Pacebacteria bacterium]|nr:manganese-dependent inorganic pyrophosphatase [Candidatus Paceibacterota bacterium]